MIWAAAGRSHATAKRAELADLVAVPDVAELARRAHVVVSICPPHAARAVAEEVAAALAGRPDPPLYVDANAVAPATVQGIGALLGAPRVVDGAIIGPPAWEPGRTVLWLSGAAAPAVAELFAGSPSRRGCSAPTSGRPARSRRATRCRRKALPTVWAALADAADAYGVRDALRDQLARDGVDLAAQLDALHVARRGEGVALGGGDGRGGRRARRGRRAGRVLPRGRGGVPPDGRPHALTPACASRPENADRRRTGGLEAAAVRAGPAAPGPGVGPDRVGPGLRVRGVSDRVGIDGG